MLALTEESRPPHAAMMPPPASARSAFWAGRAHGCGMIRDLPTIVLMGFSCAGKSTILREASLRWPAVRTIDSDEHIAESFGGHIYNTFLEFGRERALDLIEAGERNLLNSLMDEESPRLLAAGPALPSRDP